MSTFGLSQENKMSTEMGKSVLALTNNIANQTKKLISIAANKAIEIAKNATKSDTKDKK